MSIFGKIKDAIFGHKAAAAPVHKSGAAATEAAPTTQPAASAAAAPVAVDVEQVLAEKAAAKGNADLNYKSSIVDLMKLLDLDASLANRKELASELGYTGATDGSAEMNIWLHKAVMRQLAANGGNVPAALTD
ncbi:MAG: DUF3597 domain-containing protein [Novosphingobium sp.]